LFLALFFFLSLERSFLALFLGSGYLLQEQRLQAGIGRRRGRQLRRLRASI
jgi:hypothetical protein